MEAQLFKGAFPEDIHDHKETKPAKNYEPCRGQVQEHIIFVSGQVLKAAKDIKAGVVKCCHGMEQADSQRPYGRIIPGEHQIA